MSITSENNKRIAKNTFMLYTRQIITLLVSLFTVRVVLDTLGDIDYGLYTVVGSVVTMFSFLSGTLATATQRFFAFEIGKKDYIQLKKTFSITLTIYIILAIVILVLAETVGIWFLNNKMTIPADRMDAARWIYQFSILSFIMTMITIPYNATIIAHEKMNIYAYVSIIEVGLKLLIVYLLVLFSFDKLKLYAVLMFGVITIITLIYLTYRRQKFKECKFSFYWDKSLFKEILSYSGWNLFGALARVFNNQGINIILNLFFGPIVNTARGIAFQVNNAVSQFVKNFMVASRPQIIKYYASGDHEQMMKLVFQSSKISFLLLFSLSMPILLETETIFNVWLKNTPEHVIIFTRLTIIAALIDSISYSLMTAAQSTGKIKKYQSVIGGIMILNLPIAYVFLKLGYSPESIFYLAIINSIICLFLRLKLLKNMVNLSIKSFLREVLYPLSLTTIMAYIIPFILLIKLEPNFYRFIIVLISGGIFSSLSTYFIGLKKNEQKFIIQAINKYYNEHFSKKNNTPKNI